MKSLWDNTAGAACSVHRYATLVGSAACRRDVRLFGFAVDTGLAHLKDPVLNQELVW